MDPFCEIEVHKKSFKTKTHLNAGKKPKWNQKFTIDVKNLTEDLSVIIWDECIGDNDVVAYRVIKLSEICVHGKGID